MEGHDRVYAVDSIHEYLLYVYGFINSVSDEALVNMFDLVLMLYFDSEDDRLVVSWILELYSLYTTMDDRASFVRSYLRNVLEEDDEGYFSDNIFEDDELDDILGI